MQMIPFIRAYMASATQMRTHAIAGNWARLAAALAEARVTLTATEAAAWADLGLLPEEAGQLILDGITAAQYHEMETYAEEQAGGSVNLAAQRIRQKLDSGEWIITSD